MIPSFPFLRKLGQNPLFWLLFISGFTLLYFFVAHEGFYFGDDYSYSLYAHQLLHGGFHFDDYSFCHRFLIFVPTALFYWLWGTNAYTTTLWPLLCSLGTLLLLYLAFHRKHPVATCWALVLLGLYYFQLNTVNYLYPDNILLFFTTACLLVVYRASVDFQSVRVSIGWGALFAFLNLLAFLTKETIIYALPFYLVLFFYHWVKRENLLFWTSALLMGCILLGTYLLLYKMFAGDAFERFHDIATAGLADTTQAYFDSPASVLPARLTYKPLVFFISSGLAIPLGFTLLNIFIPRPFTFTNLYNPLAFWLMVSICMLLPIWFGSVSLNYYKPMTLLPRMFHPLLPAFCLSAGLAVEQAWNKRTSYLFLAILFGVSTACAGDQMWIMYLPLSALFAFLFLLKQPVPHWAVLAVVALILGIRPVYFMIKPTVSYYFEQEEIIKQHLSHPKGKYIVFIDSTMLRRYSYFYGFDLPKNYSFRGYTGYIPSMHQQADTIFLLINNGILEHPELMIKLREKDILPLFPAAQLLNQKGKVKLFVIPKESQP